MARRVAQRRIAIAAVVAMVVGAVVGLAVATNGEPASALRLLTGGAWLENASAGTVSHVNGYSGGTDGQATVGRPGDPFAVVQRADGAYVLDLRTGRLSRLDDATMDVTAAAVPAEPASGLQIVAGASTTWILDRSSGILQELNPSTLAAIGPQIPLGGPTGAAIVDQSGAVWVPVRPAAVVDQVNPGGSVSRHPFGHPDDAVQVADTASGVWAVDPQTTTAASVSVPGVHEVALPALSQSWLLGASESSPNLVLVSGTQVLDIDTSHPSLASVAVPAAAQSTQVAVVSSRAYLLDAPADQLETINLSPFKVLAPITVPPGANQLVSKDQLVFVNGSNTPQALVIGPNGSVTNITKYSPPAPAQTARSAGYPTKVPGVRPSPAAGPVPFPSPSSNPLPGGAGASSPPPSVPGTSPPPTPYPPPTSPPTTAPPKTSGPPPSLPPTVPGAPPVTQVTAGNGLITVGWSPPASDGGSPVLKYQVTGSPTPASASEPGSTTSATLTGLPNGASECVQVQAINRVGGGPLSAAGQWCATPQLGSPGRVAGVTATESAPGQITLSWRQPSLGPYHTPIKSYTVVGGPTKLTVPATSTVVTALDNSKTYTFTVTATNVAGISGPASPSTQATTWSPPGAVANLTVTPGDQQLTVSWAKPSVPSGSPKVGHYEYSVGGQNPRSTTLTSVSVSVQAWTNEKVTVYAVNPVGNGAPSSASGTAWARSGTVLCVDSLSGDQSVQNVCTNTGGAWSTHPSSVRWLDVQAATGHAPQGGFEYLCTTYESGFRSGDVYGLANAPTQQACTTAVPSNPGNQPKDVPHVIAEVSKSRLDSASQQLCEYVGQSSGTSTVSLSYTSQELSPCGTVPSNLKGATRGFSFWT